MVLVIATCGLVYELALATVGSYVLGDSVTQFSLVIGLYLSALGLGAWLSRFVDGRLAKTFVDVELATALLGGFSAPVLLLAAGFGDSFQFLLLAVVLGVGLLVGLELPLLMRILESRLAFKELVARTLGYDYAGSLVGSLGFSLWLLPRLGLPRAALLCGIANALVGLGSTRLLASESGLTRRELTGLRARALLTLALLMAGFFAAPRLLEFSERQLHGNVVFSQSSHYQRLVLIDREGSLELWLNGHLQFAERDEHRYHEALVHPLLASASRPRHVLVGGGGDGLALRELLRWPELESITLVDLDPAVTELALTHPRLVALNRDSLRDPRVRVINADAFTFLAKSQQRYDVELFDFPDPTAAGIGKLYSTRFFAMARDHLAEGGVIGLQATSPYVTRKSYWSIVATVQAVGLHTLPYRVYLPSFGDWGFVLASPQPISPPRSLQVRGLRSLDDRALAALFEMPDDTSRVEGLVNRLDNQSLVTTYLEESARFEP